MEKCELPPFYNFFRFQTPTLMRGRPTMIGTYTFPGKFLSISGNFDHNDWHLWSKPIFIKQLSVWITDMTHVNHFQLYEQSVFCNLLTQFHSELAKCSTSFIRIKLRGCFTPNLKLACFVCYLKIINTLSRNNACIFKGPYAELHSHSLGSTRSSVFFGFKWKPIFF